MTGVGEDSLVRADDFSGEGQGDKVGKTALRQFANFAGEASFDGDTVLIGGQRQTAATPVFVGSVVSNLPTNYSALV